MTELAFVIDDPYLRRAQQAVDAARQKAARYKGACAKCIHSRRKLFDRVCDHPAVRLVAFSHEHEDEKRFLVKCSEQRRLESPWGPVVCGPDGALFQGSRLDATRHLLATMSDDQLQRLAGMDELFRMAHENGLRFRQMERLVEGEKVRRGRLS